MKDHGLVQLSESAYALVNSEDDSLSAGFGSNQGIVILESSVLVFDSGFNMNQTKSLQDTIASLTKKPVKYVINSHDHSDHVFGNYAFVANSDIPEDSANSNSQIMIFAHEICRQNMARNSEKRMKQYSEAHDPNGLLFGGLKEIALPNFTYVDNSIRIRLEGKEMCLFHPPTGAHTLGDTLLAVPDEKVLFAGDTIWNGFYPNLEDSNLEGWISLLGDLDLKTYQVSVPGHGKVCSPTQVREFHDYLIGVRRRILDLYERIQGGQTADIQQGTSMFGANVSEEEKRECFILPGTEAWKFRPIVDSNVRSLFGTPI
ncbi:MAG TPA: MBL fold metallo-hydrolase [Nitrososphaerales archaeon]|nr:MBL fold metallo-hydrolase [Nitrososphaerales archaeon]